MSCVKEPNSRDQNAYSVKLQGTHIFRFNDKFEHEAGRRIVLIDAVVLRMLLLYFRMITLRRSLSSALYASRRIILQENGIQFRMHIASTSTYWISKCSFGDNCRGNGAPRLFPSDDSRNNFVAIFLIFSLFRALSFFTAKCSSIRAMYRSSSSRRGNFDTFWRCDSSSRWSWVKLVR